MRRWLLAALAAAGLAVALYLGKNMTNEQDASSLPPDPAGRRAALLRALHAVGYGERQANILLGQAVLETDNLSSAAFAVSLSPWNRHVGSGRYGNWNGHVAMLGPDGRWKVYADDKAATAEDPHYAREHLRCFDTLEQAVRDMQGLLQLPLYAHAAAALRAGDAHEYAEAIADGNGKEGFVGPVGTAKAVNYTAGLISQFRALGVA